MIFLLELTTDEVFFSISISEGDLDIEPVENVSLNLDYLYGAIALFSASVIFR